MRRPIISVALLLVCLAITRAATIPAGTTLVVRTIDPISSSDQAGKRFAGKLDTNLIANGKIVARAGSQVYGRVNSAHSAGRAFGQSQLAISLIQVSINGRLVSVTTNNSLHSGERSARKTAGGAGAGALVGAAFDGGRGAGRGAAIGAAATLLRPGQAIAVPAGTLLDFQLASAVSL